jgi:hypothetical protein
MVSQPVRHADCLSVEPHLGLLDRCGLFHVRALSNEKMGPTSFIGRISSYMSVASMYITFAVYMLLHDILMRIYIYCIYIFIGANGSVVVKAL